MSKNATAEIIPLTTWEDGCIRIAGTRVPLDTIVGAFEEGATAEEIAQGYPTVQVADVYLVIGYYLRHKAEMQSYLGRRAAEADAIRQQVEARWNPKGVRDRLLARQRSGTIK